ncbi:MAG TPA: hypothetical protein VMH35_18475 [Streptosporangiaceae bacterium]|nr:hypothetical protein [Streptosporangiaceae bacterium]
MSTYFEDMIRLKTEHLADLRKTTAEVERQISDARDSMQREFTRSRPGPAGEPGYATDLCQCDQCQPTLRRVPSPRAAYVAPRPDYGFAPDGTQDREAGHFDVGQDEADLAQPSLDEADGAPDEDRTTVLINQGRSSARRRKLPVTRKVVIGAIAVATLLGVFILLVTSSGGASWPASVARVQDEIARACENPNVMSEPGQVNFACARGTRQILWVFSLITSSNNPDFADTRSGRQGLEPITPGQGGQVAAALNLHHPYDPANPMDSIQVAARAINDIIGGVTVANGNGNPVVQPGLESSSANCVRYTGSAALDARQGYPDVCARPLTPGGQAALVRDVYLKWVVGAPAVAAQDAAVLFENAKNPGNPRVQFILTHLPASALAP